MNPVALRLAAELGGSVLSSPGGGLILVEHIQRHGLAQVLVVGRSAAELLAPLEAIHELPVKGVALNVACALPLPGSDFDRALEHHRRRIGALVTALDAGLPWLAERPMLAHRLPGRLFSPVPVPLAKAPLGPLEKAELKRHLSAWGKDRRSQTFRRPEWREVAGGFEVDLWPGVAIPAGCELLVPPLVLPTATPVSEVLRAALRSAMGCPIPFLPVPGDPAPLHALSRLAPAAMAFRGPVSAWAQAFAGLSRLPAPLHFCARC
jgi:hypothetical protein